MCSCSVSSSLQELGFKPVTTSYLYNMNFYVSFHRYFNVSSIFFNEHYCYLVNSSHDMRSIHIVYCFHCLASLCILSRMHCTHVQFRPHIHIYQISQGAFFCRSQKFYFCLPDIFRTVRQRPVSLQYVKVGYCCYSIQRSLVFVYFRVLLVKIL